MVVLNILFVLVEPLSAFGVCDLSIQKHLRCQKKLKTPIWITLGLVSIATCNQFVVTNLCITIRYTLRKKIPLVLSLWFLIYCLFTVVMFPIGWIIPYPISCLMITTHMTSQRNSRKLVCLFSNVYYFYHIMFFLCGAYRDKKIHKSFNVFHKWHM